MISDPMMVNCRLPEVKAIPLNYQQRIVDSPISLIINEEFGKYPSNKNVEQSPIEDRSVNCVIGSTPYRKERTWRSCDFHKSHVGGGENQAEPQKYQQPEETNIFLKRTASGLSFWRRAINSSPLSNSKLKNFIFNRRPQNQRRNTLEPTSACPTARDISSSNTTWKDSKKEEEEEDSHPQNHQSRFWAPHLKHTTGSSSTTLISESSSRNSSLVQRPGTGQYHRLTEGGRNLSSASCQRRHSESHPPNTLLRRNTIFNFTKQATRQGQQQQQTLQQILPLSSASKRTDSCGCRHDPVHGLKRLSGSTLGLVSPVKFKAPTKPRSSPSSSPFARFIPFKGFNRHSESMGLANCCAGREDEATKAMAKEKYEKTWDFLQGQQILSDVDRFDKAYAENDIKGFVDLLNSAEHIESLPDKMHPWAADPTTVGALATTQLAIMAAKEDPTIKDRIRDSGAIPLLVKNLNSKAEDLMHASVVALSFLSVDSPRNCIEIFECGALPALVKGMESSIEGLRGATAQTCRNIYVLDLRYRADFKKHGGIQTLVKNLDLPTGEFDSENLFNQLEAVYHLEDLILEGGEELPEYVSEVKKAGAVRRLEALVKVNNQDLIDAAQYLLVRLAD